MIALWGLPQDGQLARVRDALGHLGSPVVFVDQRCVLEMSIELSVSGRITCVLHDGTRTIDLAGVRAAYLRPDDPLMLPATRRAGVASAVVQRALAVESLLWSWADLTRALVINRPAAMAANDSKPFQAEQIRAYGFRVPDTILTTDPETARAFWQHHGAVVYKSISSVRSIVARLSRRDSARLDYVRWCPTQFQQCIPGPDYRVHVVGTDVLACEVTSDADDYRYPEQQGAEVDIRPYRLPAQIAARCRGMAFGLGLAVAGIDLRRTPEGEWYCFEVNPAPAFSYFEAATGQMISLAIAELLDKAAKAAARANHQVAKR